MLQGNTIILAGIAVIFIGFILVFMGTVLQGTHGSQGTEGAQGTAKNTEVKTSGVILIGPIPIIFGNDKGMVITGVVMAIIIMILAYFLFYRGVKIF